MTIRVAGGGDCDEVAVAKWHWNKVAEDYTRLLLVVMSAKKQIRGQNEPVLIDWNEDGFDVAFDAFRSSMVLLLKKHHDRLSYVFMVIQGVADADVGCKLTQDEAMKAVEFCLKVFQEMSVEEGPEGPQQNAEY